MLKKPGYYFLPLSVFLFMTELFLMRSTDLCESICLTMRMVSVLVSIKGGCIQVFFMNWETFAIPNFMTHHLPLTVQELSQMGIPGAYWSLLWPTNMEVEDGPTPFLDEQWVPSTSMLVSGSAHFLRNPMQLKSPAHAWATASALFCTGGAAGRASH